MKVRVRRQTDTVVGWLAEDSGEFVFFLCRRGFEQMLGRRMKIGEEVTVEFNATELEE